MNFFDVNKSILENLYLLSGPILAILGFLVFFQIREQRRTLRISSQRAAAELAIKQIELYNTTIINLMDAYYAYKVANNLTNLEVEVGSFTKDYLTTIIPEKDIINYLLERLKCVQNNSPLMLTILNHLEMYATCFIREVADEKIAFSANGASYCASVESLFIEIAFYGIKGKPKYFENIKALYELWNPRLSRLQLEDQQKELMAQLQGISDKTIRPLGTK